MIKKEKISIQVDGHYEVSALLMVPADAQALLVLGHGAGAGMEHPFMDQLANNLSGHKIATMRYNFPYMEQGKRSPNAPALSESTVRAAVEKAGEISRIKMILAGGKSYGGRMSSQAQSKQPMPSLKGLVFFGFPLHAPGRPASHRGEHLKAIDIPMLFLQGSRDKLALVELMNPLIDSLGSLATMKLWEGADHGFNMLKSAAKTSGEVRQELATATAEWAATL